MIAVAETVPALAGESRRRADAVTGGFPMADGSDEQALREEFNSLIAVA